VLGPEQLLTGDPEKGSLEQFQEPSTLANTARVLPYLLLGGRRLYFLLTTHRYMEVARPPQDST